MKQLQSKPQMEFKTNSLNSQKKIISDLKKQLKKEIQEKNEIDNARKFLGKYLEDILSDHRMLGEKYCILNERFLMLKNSLQQQSKITSHLIESNNHLRERSNNISEDFNDLCIDYNLLNDSLLAKKLNLGERNISDKNLLRIVKS